MVKKKIDTELETYNIGGGVTAETREFYGRLKNRAIVQLRGIQGSLPDFEKELEEIDAAILSAFKPQRFDGHEGREVQLIKQFERSCGLLTKHMGIQHPEKLTVRKYYMRLEDLKQQFKDNQPQKHANGRRTNINK